jgi:hypothetical protein
MRRFQHALIRSNNLVTLGAAIRLAILPQAIVLSRLVLVTARVAGAGVASTVAAA